MSNAQPHEHVHHDHQHHEGHHTHVSLPTTGLKDPVCGMDVTEQSHHSTEHEGRRKSFSRLPSASARLSLSPKRRNRAQPIPAPCTRRCSKTIPETAPSAA